MNYTENNNLIDAFMGQQITDISGNIKNDRELLYHTDWNWLMPVVEKIENYNEFTYVGFAPNGCAIDVYVENGFQFSVDCDTKIEAVYTACVEFIKWYNQNKK